jgi:hypothetical protein
VKRGLESVNDVYIFAVANTGVNTGLEKISDYGGTEADLLEKLNAADSYDKLKEICVLRPDANDVNVYATSLTMSGWYAADGESYNDPDNIPTVTIAPGENNLTGAINLRRVLSYNKFNIFAGQYVTMTLNSWKVCNVPAGSSIIEQSGNAADSYTGSASFYNTSKEDRMFTETTVDGKDGKYFEFYQMENKHTGLDYAADGDDHVGINPDATDWYNEREREFKENNLNTGVFRSLVKADKSNKINNNASYVVLNADLDYYVAAPADGVTDWDPTTAEPIDPSSTVKKIHRTANINYTIHLGYCEGKENGVVTLNTAKDFNCRRNSYYTYNVTINGVKNVVVEAHGSDEPQPGTDGWVRDDTGTYQRLDSHYCEFNISLTDAERNSLGYRITSPYAGKYYYYYRSPDGDLEKTEGMNPDLYSWIKFYPTSEEGVLAEYNGGYGKNTVKDGKTDGTKLWTFDDLCKPNVKDSPYEAESDGKKWYTVFIDEYVYTFDDQGGVESSWPNYVNQDDRIAEFIIKSATSKDTESTYSYNKYAFAQKSIQSYYASGTTAIGIEHTDETYCLNMKWEYLYDGYGWPNYSGERTTEYYNLENGRYNLYHYLDAKKANKWANVAQQTVPASVQAGDNGEGCVHPAASYPVFMSGNVTTGQPSKAPTPDDNNVYYANSICMNRNRDLNGDGEITPDEIRWFNPTSSQYIQLAIGQSELPDPLIRFTDYGDDYFIPAMTKYKQERAGTYIFHYITSDYQYYWAEQLCATGDNVWSGWSPQLSQAYTVRCARNLGSNPSNTPTVSGTEIDPAINYDSNTLIFTQTHFSDAVLRGYNKGGIAPNDYSEASARPYKKFEVAKTYCTNISDEYIGFGSNGTVNFGSNGDYYTRTMAWQNSLNKNGICGQYTQSADKSDKGTWRAPNASEMGIMWIAGILQNTGYFWSCSHDYFIKYQDNWTIQTDRTKYPYYKVYLGYNDFGDRKVIGNDMLEGGREGNIRVRCVRDVR